MSPIRTVFLGTPDFALPTLQMLLEMADVELVACVTQPDRPAGRGKKLVGSPVKALAAQAGLELLQPARLKADEAKRELEALGPIDVAVTAAYGQLLDQALLDWPRHGCLNVHASLLPRWRGAAPVQRALLAGDTELGVTLMRMELGLDSGPMLAHRIVPDLARANAGEVLQALARAGASLVRDTLGAYVAGELTAAAQDEAASTHAPKLRKEESWLPLDAEARVIEAHVRAFAPKPGSAVMWQGKRLKVLATDSTPRRFAPSDGRARLLIEGKRLYLCNSAGEGLRIDEVQSEGRPAMRAEAFLSGHASSVAADPWITAPSELSHA